MTDVVECGPALTWIADPDERMERASHAISVEGETWLIDPVACEGLHERLDDRPPVAGVAVLLDRHRRDADLLARSFDVPVAIPEAMDIDDAFDAPVHRIDGTLGETAIQVETLIDWPVWTEATAYHESSETLIVPEAVGTAAYERSGGERVGIHPALRLIPPRSLGRFGPDHLLVGHGHPICADASDALDDALASARRRAPAAYWAALRSALGWDRSPDPEPTTIHATADLIDVLLEQAADREPSDLTAPLATTPAGQLDCDLDPETPVFTHFYWPSESSVSAVFGVDLSTPPARTSGRFCSHPDGDPGPSVTDDLHSVVIVATPPWDREDVRAYDHGGQVRLAIHDIDLPEEHIADDPHVDPGA
ncbi:MAG: hypothetical protein ABEJ86_05560 [Halococcoides sp.]